MTGGKVAGKRFFLRRLQSGAILLVRKDAPAGGARTHMTAFLSGAKGRRWQSYSICLASSPGRPLRATRGLVPPEPWSVS